MFNLVRNVHGEVWGCDLWCGSRSIRFQNIFIKINSNIYHETNSCFCWCLINLLEDVSDILNSILTFDRVESVSQRLDWSRNVWKMFFWYHRECWTAWENILKKSIDRLDPHKKNISSPSDQFDFRSTRDSFYLPIHQMISFCNKSLLRFLNVYWSVINAKSSSSVDFEIKIKYYSSEADIYLRNERWDDNHR